MDGGLNQKSTPLNICIERKEMIEINPEKAIRYIQEHAEKYAKAKGDVAFTENYLKVIKSQQMNKS